MKVSIAKFDYNSMKRKLLVLSRPSDSYFGIEFETEDELENYLVYLEEKASYDEYLKMKYGTNGENYKRFKVGKMTRLTEGKKDL